MFCEHWECDGVPAYWLILYADEQRYSCRAHLNDLAIDGATVCRVEAE